MAPQAKESSMRRIVVTEFISLDGVVEDPGGAEGYKHGGWRFKFNDPAEMQYKVEETFAHDAMLLGRVTYEGFAAAWPGRTDEAGFADRFNSMKKYVVSSTLTDPEWTNSEVRGDIIVHGSVRLVQSLLALGLVDELRLMMFPVVLGSGKRLFAEADEPITLRLASAQPTGSGSVILTYHR
jgi:dihydrofolate reductase